MLLKDKRTNFWFDNRTSLDLNNPGKLARFCPPSGWKQSIILLWYKLRYWGRILIKTLMRITGVQ